MYIAQTLTQRTIRELLPTKREFIVIVPLLLLVILLNILSVLRSSSEGVGYLESLIDPSLHKIGADSINFIIQKIATADAVTLFVWGMFGALVYIVFWFLHSVVAEANDTFQSTFKYVHPKGFHSSTFYLLAIFERIITLLSFTGFAYLLALIIKTFLPGLNESVAAMQMSADIGFIIKVIYYSFIILLSFHGLIVFYRFAFGRYHHQRSE